MITDYINIHPKRTLRSRIYTAMTKYTPNIAISLWVLAWVSMTVYVLTYPT